MKKIEKLIFLSLAFILFCFAGKTAAAVEVPDLDRDGSITVVVRDTETQKPIAGGSLNIYQVAAVKAENGNYSFELTDAFAGSRLALDDVQSEALASKLAEYARQQNIAADNAEIGEEGEAKLAGLQLGLYLVTQDTAAKGYAQLDPFLVTIPMKGDEGLIYDVNASPKAGCASEAPVTTVPTLPQTGQLWWPVPLLAILGMAFVALGCMRRKYAK